MAAGTAMYDALALKRAKRKASPFEISKKCAKAIATDALCIRDEFTNEIIRSTKDMIRGIAFAPPPCLTSPAADQLDSNLVSVVAAKRC